MKLDRRKLLAACTGVMLGLAAYPALAAQAVVEIIAFAHPPVESALKPTRQWLARQGAKLRIVEIDMESPQAQARLKALGLKGHLPLVIVIDGQYRYTRPDGGIVEFVGFPGGPATAEGAKSGWSAGDIEAALKSKR